MEREPIYNKAGQQCGLKGWMYSFLAEQTGGEQHGARISQLR